MSICKNGIRYAVTAWQAGCAADPDSGTVTGQVTVAEGNAATLSTQNIKVVSHAQKSVDVGNFDGLEFSSTPVCTIAGTACTAANKPAGCGKNSDFTSAPEKVNGKEFRIETGPSGVSFKICKQYSVTVVPFVGANRYGPTCALLISVSNQNDPPTWSAGTLTQTRNIPERSKINTEVKPAVTAVDADVGQELRYELINDEDGMFRIGACTGVIYVAKDGVLDFGIKATYTLRVKVTDDPTFFSPAAAQGASIEGIITINVVNVNDAPTFKSPSIRFSIAEIGASQTTPSSVKDQTEDADNDPLEFTITDNSGMFAIDLDTGVIKLAANMNLDFEMQKVFDVTVTISDGMATASQLFTIDVTDSNDAPTFPSDVTRNIPENSPVSTAAGSSFSGSDIDTKNTWGSLTYSLVSGNTGDAFKVVGANNAGTIKVKTNGALNFETLSSYNLKVRVTDGGGLSDEGDVLVAVLDVNEKPTITPPGAVSVNENALLASNVGLPIQITDPDSAQTHTFEVNPASTKGNLLMILANGQLRVAGAIDFEDTNTFGLSDKKFALVVTAVDNGAPALSDTITVDVVVNDVNEPPEIVPSQTYTVDENSQSEFIATVQHRDLDANANGQVTFKILGGNKYLDEDTKIETVCFEMTPDGKISSAPGATLDYEKEGGFLPQVQVEDGGTPKLNAIGFVSIQVQDVNEPPVLQQGASFTVSQHNKELIPCEEACAPGTNVGTPLQATDQDDQNSPNADLTFSIVSNDDDTFEIDDKSGQLRIKTVSDRLTQTEGKVFTITVKVEDNGAEKKSDTATVTITTTFQNFSPKFDGSNAMSFNLDENDGTKSAKQIATFVATDAQDQTIKYSMDAKPALGLTAFSIDENTGVFSTMGNAEMPITLDYESIKHPSLSQGQISFTIIAEDNHGASKSHTFLLSVKDINEPPTAQTATGQVPENSAANTVVIANVAKSDPDKADENKLTFNLLSNGNGKFKLSDPAKGEIQTTSDSTNFEELNSFSLDLEVIDTQQNKERTTLFITVTDVNEPPSVNDKKLDVMEDVSLGTSVTTAVAADPDTVNSFKWKILAGNDRGDFALQEVSAVLSVAKELDFEDCESYSLTIEVDDGGNGVTGQASLKDTATFTITVKDVNDVSRPHFNGTAYIMNTAGGTRVRLFGSNWGPTSDKLSGQLSSTPTVKVGPASKYDRFEATNCAFERQQRDAYEIVCDAPPGLGVDLLWTVQIGDHEGPPSQETSRYETPVLTKIVDGTDLVTNGGQVVKLQGKGLGPLGDAFSSEIKVSYRNQMNQLFTPSGCVVSKAHEEIECTSAPGTGFSLSWTAEVGTLTSNVIGNGTSSYAPPVVSSIVPLDTSKTTMNRLNTIGGETLLLGGSNFGPTGSSLVATYGPDAEETRYRVICTIQNAHTSILCPTAPGIGHTHKWRISTGGQTSARSGMITSYKSPSLTRVYGPGAKDAATVGGTEVYVAGSGFGPANALPSVPCDVQSMAVGGQISANGASTVGRGTAPESDYSLRVFYGPSHALSASALAGSGHVRELRGQCCSVLSDSLLSCELSPGTGRNHSWIVSVGDQISPIIHAATSYAPPVVIFYSGPGAANANTLGGEKVLVEGRNLGPAGNYFVDSVSYGIETGEEFPLNTSRCSVSSAHVLLECETVAGAGRGLQWVLVIDGQRSVYPTTYYAMPEILHFSGPGSSKALSEGGQDIYIHGKNLATSEFLGRVTYGPYGQMYEATNCSVVEASIKIKCTTAAGVGGFLKWVVRVQGQESATSVVFTDYEKPNIEEIFPAVGPTQGGVKVVLTGTNFGSSDALSQPWVIFGDHGSKWSETLPVTVRRIGEQKETATFILPLKYGDGHQVVLRIDPGAGDTVFSNPIGFDYKPPFIRNLNTEDGTKPGELLLTINGEDFCASTECGMLLLDGEEIPVSTWDHTRIQAYVTVTSGFVKVGVDRNYFNLTRHSNEKKFSHQSPKLEAQTTTVLQTKTFSTGGGEELELYGLYFGFLEDLRVMIGSVEATKVNGSMIVLNADEQRSKFKVRTPEGAGVMNEMIIFRGEQESEVYYFNYTAPKLSCSPTPCSEGSVYPASAVTAADRVSYVGSGNDGQGKGRRMLLTNGETDDGSSSELHAIPTPGLDVFMLGENLGTQGSVKFGSADCKIISHTHDKIVFQLPAGVGKGGPVQLSVAGQTTTSKSIRYERPIITSVLPQDTSTSGDDTIVISGMNFGPANQSEAPTVVFTCDSAAPGCVPANQALNCMLKAYSHGKIECLSPPGDGFLMRTAVTIGSQANDASSPLTTPDASVWSYGIPSITSMSPSEGPTQGTEKVYIYGENFAETADLMEIKVRIGDTLLESTSEWILEHSDNTIAVRVPPGVSIVEGHRVTVAVHGKTSLEDVRYHYLPPTLYNITFPYSEGDYPAPPSACDRYGIDIMDSGFRVCSKSAQFVIQGENFGLPCAPLPGDQTHASADKTCALEVWSRDEITDEDAPVSFEIYESTHATIRGKLAPGVGTANVWVVASGRKSTNELSFTYDAPKIMQTGWGPDLLGADTVNTFNAQGSPITGGRLFVFGRNFGIIETPVNITVGGEVCADAMWHKAQVETKPPGYPYLSCAPKSTRVGSKQLAITVATQSVTVDVLPSGVKILAKCFDGNFGLDGEFCLSCWSYMEDGVRKFAANCTGRYKKDSLRGISGSEEPISQAGFYSLPPPECETGTCAPGFGDGLERIPEDECEFTLKDGELELDADCAAASLTPGRFCHPHRFNGSIPAGDLVYEARSQRSICPYVMPCEPVEACAGNNSCTAGYVSYYESYMEDGACPPMHFKLPDGRCFAPRCGECNPDTHFRLDGVCEPCPSNPWLLPVMMVSAAILSGVAMYVFTKMKVNMIAINIGIDYFQVLSIFRKSKVKWPEEIRELLKQMQWFNFDIDMTGPECAFRSFFTFELKWYVKVLLPFVAMTIAFVSILAVSGFKKVCFCGGSANKTTKVKAVNKKQGASKNSKDKNDNKKKKPKKNKRKKSKSEEVPLHATLVSTFLTIVVFMYLVITRTAIGVFNCQQTKPKSGRVYMADKPLEECWKPGGLQSRLIAPAIIVLTFYCVGFPMAIFFIYKANRKKIFADQMLRARGTGNSRLNNPHFAFRQGLGKLYYMYKPSYYWWIQPILGRKFLLIAIGAFLRDNPSMQMAIALIIIFACFTAHIHVLPYLGPKEKMDIVAADYTHQIMMTSSKLNLIEVAAQQDGVVDENERRAITKLRHHLSDLERELTSSKKILGKYHHKIFNYNKLEEVMLASAIIVTLTGVMFTSPFLLDEENIRVKQSVTYTVIVIVTATIIYWLLFFIREICIAREQKKARAKMHWASLKHGKDHRNLLKMLHRENELDDPNFNPRKKAENGLDYDALLTQLARHVDSNAHAVANGDMDKLTNLADMDMDILDHHDDDHDVDEEHAGHHNALASLLDSVDEPASQQNNALASLLDDGDDWEIAAPNTVIPSGGNAALFQPAPPKTSTGPERDKLPPVQPKRLPPAEEKAAVKELTTTGETKDMTEDEKTAMWL
jgi:hypothetical protein